MYSCLLNLRLFFFGNPLELCERSRQWHSNEQRSRYFFFPEFLKSTTKPLTLLFRIHYVWVVSLTWLILNIITQFICLFLTLQIVRKWCQSPYKIARQHLCVRVYIYFFCNHTKTSHERPTNQSYVFVKYWYYKFFILLSDVSSFWKDEPPSVGRVPLIYESNEKSYFIN